MGRFILKDRRAAWRHWGSDTRALFELNKLPTNPTLATVQENRDIL